MLPAIVNPTVVARFGPWLGRTLRTSPGLLDTLLTKLRAGGAVVGAGVSGVVNYFKSSPAAAALTLASLASVGVDVKELYEGVEVDSELQGLLRGLDEVVSAYTPSQRAEASNKLLKVAARSENLGLKLAENEVDTLAAIEVLSWARSFFGSPQSALRAHHLLQSFIEMPVEDVRTGFATLRLN